MRILLTILSCITFISGTAFSIQPIGSLGQGRLEEIFFLPDGTILPVLVNRVEIVDPNTNATLATFSERTERIGESTISADGSQLAIVTSQSKPAQTVVEIWDIASRQQICEWMSQTYLRPIVLDPDLTMLAGYSQGNIYLWNMVAGEETGKIEWPQQTGFILLAFSPDAQQLLASNSRISQKIGADEIWKATTDIWEVSTGQRLGSFEHFSRLIHTAYSPDNRWLVTADINHRISLWNTQTWERLRAWFVEDDVKQLSFSSDSRRIYIATGRSGYPRQAHRVSVWDVESGKQLNELGDETIHLAGFSISRDEKLAALWYFDGFVALWDITQNRRIAFWTDYVTPSWGHLTPDGRFFIALGSAALTIWDLKTQSLQKVIFPDKFFRRIAVSPDGQAFAVDCDPWIEIRRIPTGQIIKKIPNNIGSTPFVFSADGKWLAVGQTEGAVIFNISNGKKLEVLQPPERDFISEQLLAFSDDNRYFAIVDYDEEVYLWERKRNRYVYRYSWKVPISSIGSMAFELSGRQIPALLIGGDFQVQVWELSNLMQEHSSPATLTVQAPIQFVRYRQLSIDAVRKRYYLLVNKDDRLQIWDWHLKKPISLPDIPGYFAANHDGSVVLTRDDKTYQTRIWNIKSLLSPKLVTLGQIKEMALLPNFPNPLNPETWIPYQLAKSAHVQISIYDVSGRLVRELNLGEKPAGRYLARQKAAYWDGRNNLGEPVSSSVYFYTLEAGNRRITQRMSVVR